MFSDSDPTASLFSKVAQQFTRQFKELGVTGGAYIYQVIPNSAATKSGLKAGDIIIKYGAKIIMNPAELPEQTERTQNTKTIPLIILRLNDNDKLGRMSLTVTGGVLGVGIMAIESF
ncbi:MAG TPA: PDZ domain-containing protein [Bacillota bacterium]|nr:PDZ domain-containing protein [Bacillota bacterium]